MNDYGMPYTCQDIELFEPERSSSPVVHARLLDPRRPTWVVEYAGTLIGYADAGPCDLPHRGVEQGDLELDRLYVMRSHHGRGRGSRLMEVALAWMSSTSTSGRWLGVLSGNLGAPRLYSFHGFENSGEYDFPVGRSIDRDFILRRDNRRSGDVPIDRSRSPADIAIQKGHSTC